MGEEINSSQFCAADYQRFLLRLKQETVTLAGWFEESRLADVHPVAGFELEAWLIDSQHHPAPVNDRFLELLNDPLASPELASFNFEVNSTPQILTGQAFSRMYDELLQTWRHCQTTASTLGCHLAMIGILPTVQNDDLQLINMSKMERYRALNREVVRMRQGKPLLFDINGEEHLRVTHQDVMLESAATSFQIHLQLNQQQAVRAYNASQILSGPMVALSANSPYLFGKDLWDETRIPLFEQAVAVGGYDGAMFGPIRRVTFGTGYARQSLLELFQENLEHYPVLLPVDFGEENAQLRHLRLHNGTIWRWNRPLLGFDEAGHPHLRIEHRVVPAGPTHIDNLANAAFYYGVVMSLIELETPPETELRFDKVRDNFYTAARLGLRASQHWLNGGQRPMRELLTETLLPLAENGLARLGIGVDERRTWLAVIAGRLQTGQNGAHWQRAWVARHGRDMAALTAAYVERQEKGEPVHEWTV
ncbi:MAG: glutamate--cysteine ligase [Proteobacteria bacterium]|jgi:gamma-glutamyl:cysteine ligase YbdK (ATP-grasp superfamily)|nr:glutamate--cysteine ligase [Pseudomonadota bacterium]